jgi:subtilisin family serine protease
VKVLNDEGNGSVAGVLAGIDYIRGKKKGSRATPMIVNMSLGGPISKALDDAVDVAINAGIVFVVAAGNERTDACLSSPARVATAITVGSINSQDMRSSFSNFGSCVNIFAPGQQITSAWGLSDDGVRTISGTSMAAPVRTIDHSVLLLVCVIPVLT